MAGSRRSKARVKQLQAKTGQMWRHQFQRTYAGRGLASTAVQMIVEIARDELGLHRIEASTLLHNVASQRVLLKSGFQQIGMAPRYLQIAGKWQNHNLYQVVLHD
jgi:[ribosomal protein S5]-alanine N-acetyltransferase